MQTTQPDGANTSVEEYAGSGATYTPVNKVELAWLGECSTRMRKDMADLKSLIDSQGDSEETRDKATELLDAANDLLELSLKYLSRQENMLKALRDTRNEATSDDRAADWLIDIRQDNTDFRSWDELTAEKKIALWEASVEGASTLIRAYKGPLLRAKLQAGGFLKALQERDL